MNALTSLLTVLLFIFFSVVSFAAKENFIHSDYYLHPKAPVAGKINLLEMDHIQQKFPLPTKPYNRDAQFGGWISPKDNSSCLNVRGLVLERDSDGPIKINSNCTVQTGLWHDPYTGKDYTVASAIQIDHVVPLKHAYMSGGFEWDAYKRCLYANYMGNHFHLLAVQGSANMSKSDKGPSEYMPANKSYGCTYLKIWLEIKYIWELRMTPPEVTSISQQVKNLGCDTEDFKIDQNEYQDQLTYMHDHQTMCKASM